MQGSYFCIVLATFCACLLCGCDGVTSFDGVIMDEDGKGIGGVSLKLEATPKYKQQFGRPRAATSDSTGTYQISFAHGPVEGEFILTATHPDYSEVQELVTNGAHNGHNIHMKRLDTSTSSKGMEKVSEWKRRMEKVSGTK